MELSKQACSLESARKLDDLKLNTDTTFFYVNGRLCADADNSDCHNSDDVSKYFCLEDGRVYQYADTDEIVNTYTSPELGEMLPVRFATYRTSDNRYHTIMLNELELPEEWYLRELQSTDAESKAQTLIFMLEHGMITAEEINGATK